jgi:hypothetical protein
MKISCRTAFEFLPAIGTGNVSGTDDLMNQVFGIILAVDITALTVEVLGIFGLVLPHGILSLEMPIAVFVGAFDLATHLEEICPEILR